MGLTNIWVNIKKEVLRLAPAFSSLKKKIKDLSP